MTGLDIEKEVIIEVAAIITDLDFNELDRFHRIVKQDQKFLDAMDEWNQNQHGKTGLTAAVPQGSPPEQVERDLCALVGKHFKERAILAGNSIATDRNFIKKYFKALESKLNYRMLDISSWKIIMKEKYKICFEKESSHRALDDIKASIAELKHYLGFIQIPQKNEPDKNLSTGNNPA